MARERISLDSPCPKCNAVEVECTYNAFQRDDLEIDSWEHRCRNCSYRVTEAYRTDEPDDWLGNVDPKICPYCERAPGQE